MRAATDAIMASLIGRNGLVTLTIQYNAGPRRRTIATSGRGVLVAIVLVTVASDLMRCANARTAHKRHDALLNRGVRTTARVQEGAITRDATGLFISSRLDVSIVTKDGASHLVSDVPVSYRTLSALDAQASAILAQQRSAPNPLHLDFLTAELLSPNSLNGTTGPQYYVKEGPIDVVYDPEDPTVVRVVGDIDAVEPLGPHTWLDRVPMGAPTVVGGIILGLVSWNRWRIWTATRRRT